MGLTHCQQCSQITVSIIQQRQSSQKLSQTSQWLLTVAMCQCLHYLILVQHSTLHSYSTSAHQSSCERNGTLLVWELHSWMVPGGNVRRANCTSHNGCTWWTTRIGSWTVTIYIMYTADISCHGNGHQLMCICYADDTQVYFHMKVGKIPVVKGMVEDCIAMSTIGLRAIDYDSIQTRRKWCGVRWREEQEISISHHSPLVTRRSLHQTSFVILECNFEPTFQLPIRSVRLFTVATTIFGNFGQFDDLSLRMICVMWHKQWYCLGWINVTYFTWTLLCVSYTDSKWW